MTQVYRNWTAMQMTETEAAEFRGLVRDARKLGWTDAALAQRISMDVESPAYKGEWWLDAVMRRRKSALGDHLRALRQVVKTSETPPAERHVSVEEYQAGRHAPAPRRFGAFVAPLPPTAAPAAPPVTPESPVPLEPARAAVRPDAPLTEDEHLEFMEMVEQAEANGWYRADLARRLGLEKNGVSRVMTGARAHRPARARFDALRALLDAAEMPPKDARKDWRRRPPPEALAPAAQPEATTTAPASAPAEKAAPPTVPVEPAPPVVRSRESRQTTEGPLTVLDHLRNACEALEAACRQVGIARTQLGNAHKKAIPLLRQGLEDAQGQADQLQAMARMLITNLTLD